MKRERRNALRTVTYSFNFTLPITNWCVNHCGYCSFRSNAPILLSLEECERRARRAHAQGVIEALVMTGEGIDRHKGLKGQLKAWGYDTYAAYTAQVCKICMEVGLLPHANIGTLEEWEYEILQPYNVSMGMMMETVSPKATHAAHRAAPTKAPERRLASLEAAGKCGVAFTTGILVGIGESPAERVAALEAIAKIHRRYGHIQEIILQPLNPQPMTPMAGWKRPPDAEIVELIPHVRRLMPGVHVQVPPNLVDDLLGLIMAGADDIGGVAPEPDHINPNRGWPKLGNLDASLHREDVSLRLRMPIYDEFIEANWAPPATLPALGRMLDRRESEEILPAEIA